MKASPAEVRELIPSTDMKCKLTIALREGGEMPDERLPLEELFSPDYATARHRFRSVATRNHWELQSLPIGLHNGHDDPLTIDVASTSNQDASKLLVLSSGVHGVEGFFGSAVQLALINHWAQCGHPDVRCLLLHAVNPYGFQWARRTNENNVDLNRNFLLPGEGFQGAPGGYAELDALLNPVTPVAERDFFLFRIVSPLVRKGLASLKQSIASGQYEYPQGLFFGGQKQERSAQLMAEHFPTWIAGVDEVVHLDFHTGLGRSGTWKLLLDYLPTAAQIKLLEDFFGPASYELNDKKGVAYDARGGFGRWCVSTAEGTRYLFLCAEFGTFGPIQVLSGLRRENQLHHWGAESPRVARATKRKLVELFCPASTVWREKVLRESIRLAELSIQGLLS